MKKLLVVIAVILGTAALILWVASWFRTPEVVATSAAKPWPGGMGPLDAARTRLKPQHANAASVKLKQLATALPKNEVVEQFVAREIAQGELTIGKPPALPDVTAIRELLLREPVSWQSYVEIGAAGASSDRTVQMTAGRALIANALAKAHANDAAAWEDLQAAWKLARSLDGQPQMMTQTAALSISRMINAVAWKMPLPAPAWLAELQARDQLRPLLESYQQQAASYWEDGSRIFPTKMLAESVEHDRQIAEGLLQTTTCDVTARMNQLGTDMASIWRRAFRYRAEREASANALRVREGKPIETKSVCTDGAWTFDGTTLRFSREIATAPPDRPMPLTLRVKPAAEIGGTLSPPKLDPKS